MSAKLYKWLVDPERGVHFDADTNRRDDIECHIVAWNTSHGRIEVRGETLDATIKKAYEIDQNPDPEQRRRLAYTPTATRSGSVWSTGRKNGVCGWYGFIVVHAELDTEEILFSVPKLPKGWKYDEFRSGIRRVKNKRMVKLYECGSSRWRFDFEITTANYDLWCNDHTALDTLVAAVGEIERAHFVIE